MAIDGCSAGEVSEIQWRAREVSVIGGVGDWKESNRGVGSGMVSRVVV